MPDLTDSALNSPDPQDSSTQSTDAPPNLIDNALSQPPETPPPTKPTKPPNLIDSALAPSPQPAAQPAAQPSAQPTPAPNLIDSALSRPVRPAPQPRQSAPDQTMWERITNVITNSPLARSLGETFDSDENRAAWEAAGPRLRSNPAFAMRHAPVTSPEAWRAMFSVSGLKELPSVANEAVNQAFHVVSDSPVAPSAAMTSTEQQAHPILTATGDVAGNLASGGNVGTVAATGGFGELGAAGQALGRLVSGGFSLSQLWDASKSSPDILRAIQANDVPRAQYLLTKAGIETGLAYLGAKHATTGRGAITGKAQTQPIPASDPLAQALQEQAPEVRQVDTEAVKQRTIAQDTVPKPSMLPGTPTARTVVDSHVPVVSATETQAAAIQRIIDNSGAIQSMGLNPEDIRTRADVPVLLESIAGGLKANLDPRVGSVIGFDAQKQLAAELGLDIEDLLNRKSGDAANAENALAARALLHNSQTRVMNYARLAATGDADYATKFAQALAQHQAIVEHVKGVAAEAGRALGSFRIAQADLPLKEISDVFSKFKELSPDALAEAAKLLSKLDESDGREINEFVEQIKPSSTADKVFEYYRNALLSSPRTVTVKAASEAAMMALEATKKVVAGGLSKLGMGEETRSPAEAWWYARGALAALQHVPDVLNGKFTLEDAPGSKAEERRPSRARWARSFASRQSSWKNKLTSCTC
jgi:hypothetical protein